MLIFTVLLFFLTIKECASKLVVESGCDKIKFQHPLFTSETKNGNRTHGKIVDSYNPVSGPTVLIVPSSEKYYNETVSILIYSQRESGSITNLPQDPSDVDSWPNSFGICTENDITLGKCQIPGEFMIEVKDQTSKDNIINRVLDFEEINMGLKPVLIGVDNARYCYIVTLDRLKTVEENDKDHNDRPIIQIHSINIGNENTIGYLEYYGSILASFIEFFLGIVIWLKIRSSDNTSDLLSPYKACFAIIVISFITSVIQILNTKQYINPVYYGTDKAVPFYFKHWKFFKIVTGISETLDDILIYLICFQFINLDKFGIKINFRKNRYGYIFVGVLIWTLMIHPFIISYRYQILYTALSTIGGNKRPPAVVHTILRECVEIFNVLNYIAIWFILYKTSQDSENKYLSSNISDKDYAQRFKLTRIWLIFSSIVIKIVGFILGRFISKLLWKFIDFIELHIEEIPYKQGATETIVANFILSMLKGLLIVLKSVNNIALPILITITLTIWWSYCAMKSTNQAESIRLEDMVI